MNGSRIRRMAPLDDASKRLAAHRVHRPVGPSRAVPSPVRGLRRLPMPLVHVEITAMLP